MITQDALLCFRRRLKLIIHAYRMEIERGTITEEGRIRLDTFYDVLESFDEEYAEYIIEEAHE